MSHSTFLGKFSYSSRIALLSAIMGMGFLGALSRYALMYVLPDEGISLSTLIINVIGCYALPFVNEWLGRRLHLPKIFCQALGVGFVGSFTTLSAIELNVFSFLYFGDYLRAVLELSITVVTTLAATVAGHYTCEVLAKRRLEKLKSARAERHGHMRGSDMR